MLDPGIFKAYDVRGLYGSELDEEGGYAIGRAYVEHFRAPLDRRRPRHARLGAVDGRRRDGGRRGRWRRRSRPRDGRHRDGLLRGRRARARRRDLRHRVAQSEAVHGHEDRPGRGVARRRRLGPRGRARRRPGRIRPGHRSAARSRRSTSGPASSTRCSPSSTSTRSRRCGSSSTPPTAWPARCCRRCSSGCRRSRSSAATSIRTAPSRTTSRTRCSRRTAPSSSRKTHEEGAALGVAYDGDADRCFFVDDTGEFVPGRLRHRAARRGDAGQEPRRDRPLRRPRQLGGAAHDRRGRRHGAGQPRRPRVHQAPDARGARDLRRRGLGALLLPRLHPGRHRRRAVPAHARADLEARREALRDPAAVPRELLHHGRDQHPGRGRAGQAAGDRAALRRRGRPGLAPRRRLGRLRHAGTSTCGRRTPSRSSASTSRRCPRRRWSPAATSSSP